MIDFTATVFMLQMLYVRDFLTTACDAGGSKANFFMLNDDKSYEILWERSK